MPTPEQYREKAVEYNELAKQAHAPDEDREFQKREQSFTRLADNEQWLADNHDKLANNLEELAPLPEPSGTSESPLATEEDHILRCLGAALIMQWNTLPTELQKKLFNRLHGRAIGQRYSERSNRALPPQTNAARSQGLRLNPDGYR